MAAIENRYEFVYLFDVENGNPNGDPDAGNMPRLDPETNLGLVTDVCLKRKVRNFVEIVKENQSPFEIYVREKGILTNQQKRAHESLEEVEKKADKIPLAREWMCKKFFRYSHFRSSNVFERFQLWPSTGAGAINFCSQH